MGVAYRIRSIEIGDGPRYFEDTVVGPCREVELADRLPEQRKSRFAWPAVKIDLVAVQFLVGLALALLLAFARAFHTGADRAAAFAASAVQHFVLFQCRNFYAQVDAVE